MTPSDSDIYKKKRLVFTRPSFRKKVIDKKGGICCNCGRLEEIQYHHIVPLINGGTNKLTNIVPICQECHSKAHDKKYTSLGENHGRPKLISFQEAEHILSEYFNLKIGTKEAKEKLGMSENNKSTWFKLTKEYKKKHNIKNFRNNIDLLNSQNKRINSRKKYNEEVKNDTK